MTEGRASKAPSRLARAVRMERDRKGWTSEKLADAAKVSHSWVRNFEAGIIQQPSADRLRALEDALGLRLGELYAASLNVPYDQLVADILTGQDGHKVPWEQILEALDSQASLLKDGQAAILKELRTLARRLSPSSRPVDEAAVQELTAHAVEEGIRQGRERAARPRETDEVVS